MRKVHAAPGRRGEGAPYGGFAELARADVLRDVGAHQHAAVRADALAHQLADQLRAVRAHPHALHASCAINRQRAG